MKLGNNYNISISDKKSTQIAIYIKITSAERAPKENMISSYSKIVLTSIGGGTECYFFNYHDFLPTLAPEKVILKI